MLTAKNLETGVQFWREEKKGWPPDLHNQLYCDLFEMKRKGLTPHWWSTLVDILWDWRAIRPRTKAYIHERGIECLHLLKDEYYKITKLSFKEQPGIADFYWNE